MRLSIYALLLLLFGRQVASGQDNTVFKHPARGFTSWQPAATWEQALLSGNGTIGALVMGQPHQETVILSHASLYLPLKKSGKDFEQASKLETIRRLSLQGKFTEAASLTETLRQEQGYTDERDPFIPAFDLKIEQHAGNIKRYQRAVNFETGEAIINWQDDNGTFTRRLFVSRPDSMVVLSIKGTGKINTSLAFRRRPVEWQQWKFVNDNIESANSDAVGQWLTYSSTFKNTNPGAVQGYEGVGRLVLKGGSSKVVNGSIQVTNADEVLLLINIKPLYDKQSSNIPAMKSAFVSARADYETLLTSHAQIHGSMFNRVQLDLGGSLQDRNLNSEEILLAAKSRMLLALVEKVFDAGRYNIISCTGTNPPNLQGLWSGTWTAPWAGGFTNDGNLPTAIGGLLATNTPELMLPYFNYHECLIGDYRKEARLLYNCRGIHIPAQETTAGVESDFGKTWCLTLWTGCAGWVAHYFYDYYQYTGDKAFLANRAYPFMKEAALFYEDFLKVGADGKLIFNPSYSPENNPANSSSQAVINATMDAMIARQLLRSCIDAAGQLHTDKNKVVLWKRMLTQMPSYKVNSDGALSEWLWPNLQDNYSHRHASHLYALYDYLDPDFAASNKLQQAAKTAIDKRMQFRIKEGGGEMAFGLVQLALASAHLGEAEKAKQLVNWLSSKYWSSSMASYHNVGELFNTDISGGLPYVITQMLCYSEPGVLRLLPALPSEWPSGRISGLLARGQVEVKLLVWRNHHIDVVLHSAIKQKIRLQLPGKVKTISGADKSRISGTNLSLPAGQDISLSIDIQ
ncbi:glycoside hydrolase family 95 protein [Mucilaginibacter sp. Bleaf8]|uniref:glycosyl hydrolase family 95 catalytic domain-containing protein n=1 Tax=Mucilaginibacter sp. Bleaf8 TaxID=2834430 RepID=UPI001BCDF9DB|nr:glycoside hydrolase N-terminal domain-containing protein [Mucilaginibacter sp. Bleaf8]MBS7563266.1 glycoside hydrolase family 95 protein [Mucilaginibacter sp. Bleaf8]